MLMSEVNQMLSLFNLSELLINLGMTAFILVIGYHIIKNVILGFGVTEGIIPSYYVQPENPEFIPTRINND